jgi:hypothetical protein
MPLRVYQVNSICAQNVNKTGEKEAFSIPRCSKFKSVRTKT